MQTQTQSVLPGHPSKFRQLRDLIAARDAEFLMEAHDGLSAEIVEEAGFKGIWASGLFMRLRPFSSAYLDDEPVHLRRLATDLAEASKFL